MKLEFKWSDSISGGLIYLAGDSLATIISNEFNLFRAIGILIIGATIYTFEIPNYFKWLELKMSGLHSFKSSLIKSLLSLLYFNPLWIARHFIFIFLFSSQLEKIGWDLLWISTSSFIVSAPVAFIVNYIIQNKIVLKNRFIASSIFSGVMAVYYSLSINWFN